MAQNVFDPSMYLDATMDKPLERRPPAEAGIDYPSIIKDVKGRRWESKEDPSNHGIAFDVQHEITLPPGQVERVGQEKILITDGFIIALTEGGTIDDSKGKNARLRAYREALNMNNKGDSFSARKMIGRGLMVQLKHEIYQGEIQERVGAVRKAT